jgi:hypothetical protein
VGYFWGYQFFDVAENMIETKMLSGCFMFLLDQSLILGNPRWSKIVRYIKKKYPPEWVKERKAQAKKDSKT